MVSDNSMADALYDHYNSILGTDFVRSRRLDLATLGVRSVDARPLEVMFTEEEVTRVVKELPNDKAPGPDGLTGLFYKSAWEVIKPDIMNALHAFWSLDHRSFHAVNEAFMVLLKKKDHSTEICDYRPISLMHSFGKLITKCLANRLATVLGDLVRNN